MQWSIERVVTLLTPLFSAVAGAVTAFIGTHIPGANINSSDVIALFVSGSTVAGGAALKWLHGRQKIVQFTGDVDHVVDTVVKKIQANQPTALALTDIEAVLKSHTSQIVNAIGSAVHAPPSVDEIAQAILTKAVSAQAPAGVPLTQPPAAV